MRKVFPIKGLSFCETVDIFGISTEMRNNWNNDIFFDWLSQSIRSELSMIKTRRLTYRQVENERKDSNSS